MIYVMLANGFEEIEALAFVDILRRAEIDVSTVSIYDETQVKGAHGITVLADYTIGDIGYLGTGIVLPGGLPGTTNLEENAIVIDLIKKYAKDGKFVGAICAAPSVLGKLGILKKKSATCYPPFEKFLVDANLSSERVAVDGNIVTSKGAGTAHDFAFKFVELIKDKKTADNIRSSMLYDI